MNTAYKWYSHHSGIIQFYSGEFYSKRTKSPVIDYDFETIDQAYDYSANIITIPSEVSLN